MNLPPHTPGSFGYQIEGNPEVFRVPAEVLGPGKEPGTLRVRVMVWGSPLRKAGSYDTHEEFDGVHAAPDHAAAGYFVPADSTLLAAEPVSRAEKKEGKWDAEEAALLARQAEARAAQEVAAMTALEFRGRALREFDELRAKVDRQTAALDRVVGILERFEVLFPLVEALPHLADLLVKHRDDPDEGELALAAALVPVLQKMAPKPAPGFGDLLAQAQVLPPEKSAATGWTEEAPEETEARERTEGRKQLAASIEQGRAERTPEVFKEQAGGVVVNVVPEKEGQR